ncbi:MAG: acyl carrier protein [Myxococcales bacterium]|nr:acyl carrier protein [Myxococcales bacterium]
MDRAALTERLRFHAQRITGDAEAELTDAALGRPFEELGIDSLHLTEITAAMLTELDVYVPMATLARTRTPREFLEVLQAEVTKAGLG